MKIEHERHAFGKNMSFEKIGDHSSAENELVSIWKAWQIECQAEPKAASLY